MKSELQIGQRRIGEQHSAFIVAELSANHRQDYKIAEESIREIKKTGADAVKLQTYTPDTITINCDNEYFRIGKGTLWDGRLLYDLYKEAYTPWEWHEPLMKLAHELGLVFFSTPFDLTAVDFLEKLRVPAYKIASFEVTDTKLISYVASKGKPVFISTGISESSDIELALETCRDAGNDQIALLKCTSEYPAPVEDVNLNTVRDMIERYKCIVGLSDHTEGVLIPAASVAIGARIIEKHFILERNLGGPDSTFSLEPNEFKSMVETIRTIEKALGEVTYSLSPRLRRSREFSRSLFAVRDIQEGEKLTQENVRSIRPGNGLHPRFLNEVLGKVTSRGIKRGTPLAWEMIKGVSRKD